METENSFINSFVWYVREILLRWFKNNTAICYMWQNCDVLNFQIGSIFLILQLFLFRSLSSSIRMIRIIISPRAVFWCVYPCMPAVTRTVLWQWAKGCNALFVWCMQVCNYPDNRQHLPLPAIPCGGSLQCPRSLLTQEENEYCSSCLRSSVRHNTQWHVFAVAAVLGEDKAGDTLRGNSQSECVWISGEQEGVMNELEVERERED